MAPRKPAAPAPEPTPDTPEPTPDTPAPGAENLEQPTAEPGVAAADDIPVFAPAEEPTPEVADEPVIDIPDWLAQNYRALIADPDRNDSFTKLADRSEGQLAAWARREAALAGEDVTPVDAEGAQPTVTREGTEK